MMFNFFLTWIGPRSSKISLSLSFSSSIHLSSLLISLPLYPSINPWPYHSLPTSLYLNLSLCSVPFHDFYTVSYRCFPYSIYKAQVTICGGLGFKIFSIKKRSSMRTFRYGMVLTKALAKNNIGTSWTSVSTARPEIAVFILIGFAWAALTWAFTKSAQSKN